MTEFELLLIPLSLILGLGVTQILGGVIQAVRFRRRTAMHWLPLLWAFSILLYNVLYFNVLYDQIQLGRAWTWSLYGSILGQVMLIFLGAGLILPANSTDVEESLLADFDAHGRLALIPIAILLGAAPVMNHFQHDSPWIGLNNLFNVILTALIAIVLLTDRKRLRAMLSVAFAVLTFVGMVFVWASPGNYAHHSDRRF